MARFNTIDDMDLDGKVVLTRVDLNVPVENGRVTDATRIEKIVPTVKAIQKKGGIPVLLAHFARPKGKRVDEMSLRQIVPALEQALGQPVAFAAEAIEGEAKRAVAALKPGDVLLLENTRFYPGEEANEQTFTASLAALGQAYVNDAFSASHRAHASTEGLARLIPAGAGKLMEAELNALDAALGNPERPVVAVVGGAKVSTKLDLLSNLITKVEHLVIGGGMANTFLVAQGISSTFSTTSLLSTRSYPKIQFDAFDEVAVAFDRMLVQDILQFLLILSGEQNICPARFSRQRSFVLCTQ